MTTTEVSSTERSNADGPAGAAAPIVYVSVAEFAAAWSRSEYQVREWCKAGRVKGARRAETPGGRGPWEIPATELPQMGATIPSAGNRGGL